MTLAILYMGGTHTGTTREYSSKRNKREKKIEGGTSVFSPGTFRNVDTAVVDRYNLKKH